jgi:hypothetical protein
MPLPFLSLYSCQWIVMLARSAAGVNGAQGIDKMHTDKPFPFPYSAIMMGWNKPDALGCISPIFGIGFFSESGALFGSMMS